MGTKDRLAKIRSIIRQLEEEMDQMEPDGDQVPMLRAAIVEIIIAVGPQESGSRRPKGGNDKRKR